MSRELEDFADLDYDREKRQGVPEAVFAAGKTLEQSREITRQLHARLNRALVTRASPELLDALGLDFPEGRTCREAATFASGRMPLRAGRIAVVCAGTSDLKAAREAEETLWFLGFSPVLIPDAGVAGLHRIQRRRTELETMDLVVCAAGMEASLPTVLASLVACPVIAIPVATDAERGWQGVPALLSMLNSCVPGVMVVNVDNGFGAACAAARILGMPALRTAED